MHPLIPRMPKHLCKQRVPPNGFIVGVVYRCTHDEISVCATSMFFRVTRARMCSATFVACNGKVIFSFEVGISLRVKSGPLKMVNDTILLPLFRAVKSALTALT